MGGINKVLAGRTISRHSGGDVLSKHSPMHSFVERIFGLKPLSLVFALAQKILKCVQQRLLHPLRGARFTFQSYLTSRCHSICLYSTMSLTDVYKINCIDDKKSIFFIQVIKKLRDNAFTLISFLQDSRTFVISRIETGFYKKIQNLQFNCLSSVSI